MIPNALRAGLAFPLLALLALCLASGCGEKPAPEKLATPALEAVPRPITLPRPTALSGAAGATDTLALAWTGDSLQVLDERWPDGASEIWLELETPAGRGWAPESAIRRPAGEAGRIATH